MKKLFFVFLIYGFDFFPQESSYQVELFFGTEQAYGGHITFTLSNQGQVWGGEKREVKGEVLSFYFLQSWYFMFNKFINPKHNTNKE